MNNIMFCSCGRRVQLFKFLKDSLGDSCKIIATDLQSIAPALYAADKHYLTPRIDASNYIDTVLKIAKDNDVKAITTLIDPEIEILAKNRERFEENNIIVLAPSKNTASHCFDKYEMFCYLKENNIRTVLTYDSLEHFIEGYNNKEIDFPVFIKPRTGSGSVGIHKCTTMEELRSYFVEAKFDYIIQEFIEGSICTVDYIRDYNGDDFSIAREELLRTKNGAGTTVRVFFNEKLKDTVSYIGGVLNIVGCVNMEFILFNDEYYLIDINPRFSAGVAFSNLVGYDMISNHISAINGLRINQGRCYSDQILCKHYLESVIVQ